MAEFNPAEIRIPESPGYTWLKKARIELFEGEIMPRGGGTRFFLTKDELAAMDPASYTLRHTPESIQNLPLLDLDDDLFEDGAGDHGLVELIIRADCELDITIREEEFDPWVHTYGDLLTLIQGKLAEQVMVAKVGE